MATHEEIVRRWVNRMTAHPDHRQREFARNSNIFMDGDRLYSYGYHFVLAEKHEWGFLLNGDRYSVSTTQHQGHVRAAVRYSTNVVVPFSAMEAAGIDRGSFELIDSTPDRTVHVRRHGKTLPRYWSEEYAVQFENARQNEDGSWSWDGTEHRLGETLFRAEVWNRSGAGRRTAYFISAWDNQDRNTYFLSELPHPVETLDEAYEALKPETVKLGEEEGRRVVRQGDIFAVATEITTRQLTKMGAIRSRMAYLLGTNHIATEVATLPNGATLARGFLRHRPEFRDPDHRMQEIGNEWAVIVKNTVPTTEVAA